MQVEPELEHDEAVARRILRKQIDLLYQNQTFAILITVPIVAALFIYFSSIISWNALEGWGILFIVIMLLRSGFSWMYFSARKNNTVNLKRAERFYLSGIVFTGIFWCMVTLSLFPILDLKGQVLLLLVVTGYATGAHTTIGYLKAPVFSFILLLLIPMIFAIVESDFPGARDVAFVMFLYLLFIFRSTFIFYKNTYNMLHFQEISVDRENELLLQRENANSANIAKSEFLSRMSHELRTPLNAILGLSELQLRDKNFQLTEKQLARAQKISDAGKHLLSIVNDVLDFSRIETGSMDINLEVIDLYRVIQHSIRLVEDKALLRNIVLFAEKAQSEVYVMADGNRLKQIIVNLLDNAIKFNKQGGNVSVSVSVLENQRVRLLVVDTGYGLQSEDASELFVPFSRLGAEAIGIDGTGIGLSLCKELVELMNGSIGVNSRPGEGCCFWIELPHVADEKSFEENSVPDQLHLNSVKKVKVLLVEDNLVNGEVAVDMLAAIGIDADIANDGQQAIELFNTNQYSLILMDCEMPVMDGFAATKRIRKKESELQRPAIPIVALTAHAISGAREKCVASGMDDFLSKPFSMSELYSTLSQWLDMETIEAPGHHPQDDSEKSHHIDLDEFRCDSAVLDCDILATLYAKQKKSNPALVSKLIGIYLEQSPRLLGELEDAWKKSDAESVRKISHTLKSSSFNVGAIKLSELCRTIEQTSTQGIIEDTQMQRVYQSYLNVENALNDVLHSIGQSQ